MSAVLHSNSMISGFGLGFVSASSCESMIRGEGRVPVMIRCLYGEERKGERRGGEGWNVDSKQGKGRVCLGSDNVRVWRG